MKRQLKECRSGNFKIYREFTFIAAFPACCNKSRDVRIHDVAISRFHLLRLATNLRAATSPYVQPPGNATTIG